MGRSILMVGLGLAALWVVLTVTRVVVGGLLWLVLAAAVVALAVGVVQAIRGGTTRRGLSGGSGMSTRDRTRTPV